jgi:two-component system response regulator NreC
MSAARILLVDDFLPWQSLVFSMFQSEPDLQIVAVACDGLEAVRKARELEPHVVLMDLGLPGRNGFEATRQIRSYSPTSKILFLTEHCEPDLIRAAFDIGASGYVRKSDANADLIRATRALLLGQHFVSRSLRGLGETCGSED